MNVEAELRKRGIPEAELETLARNHGALDRVLAGLQTAPPTKEQIAAQALSRMSRAGPVLDRLSAQPVTLGELVKGTWKQRCAGAPFDLVADGRKAVNMLTKKHGAEHCIPDEEGAPKPLSEWELDVIGWESALEPWKK